VQKHACQGRRVFALQHGSGINVLAITVCERHAAAFDGNPSFRNLTGITVPPSLGEW
jgi:hypothetical protein